MSDLLSRPKMNRTPLEIQDKFFGYLDFRSLLNCRLVQKNWNTLVCQNHLKNCHPPIQLWSEKTDDRRTVFRFVDLMEKTIQDFPFSNFELKLSPSWFLGTYAQNASRIIKYAKDMGKFIKRLSIRSTSCNKEMENDWVDSTLAMVSCVEYLHIETNLPFPEVKLAEPFSSLQEIRLEFYDGDEHIRLENLVKNSPSLKTLSLKISKWTENGLLDTLKIIENVPTLDLHFLHFNQVENGVNADLLNHMGRIPLKIRELELGNLCPEDKNVLSIVPQWLSTISSSLEVLSLQFEQAQPGHPHDQPRVELPYLGSLKELKLSEVNDCAECSCFTQLCPGNMPVLTKMFLQADSCLFQKLSESVFPQVSQLYLEVFDVPLHPSLDITFPNLEWLTLCLSMWEEQTFELYNLIFSRFKDLKHLEIKISLKMASVWHLCGKYEEEEIPSEDTWLLGSMKDVVAPPKFPGSPSTIRDLNLVSLKLEYCGTYLDEFMRTLTYLSSTKMLPGLGSLTIESNVNSPAKKEAKVVEFEKWLPRLLDCHQNVEFRPLEYYFRE